jgi:SAM-dependent methyltransferase
VSVAAATKKIRGRHRAGSSVESGKLYHQLPFGALGRLPAHRGNTLDRIRQLERMASFHGKSVLDLGCSAGAIGVGLVVFSRAAEVTLVDYDDQALLVARKLAGSLGQEDRVKTVCAEITPEWVRESMPRVDVVVWLSQWMWAVRQLGIAPALELLWEVSKKCDVLIFESAANDGEAGIRNSTQATIGAWLRESVRQERIRSEPNPGGWHNRRVFACSAPVERWESNCARVERVARDLVQKVYRGDQWPWMAGWEAAVLRRLDGSPGVPRLLDYADRALALSWGGWASRVGPAYRRAPTATGARGATILADLNRARVSHRDIRPANLLADGDHLNLVDFGWATIDGQETPEPPPPEMGTDPDGFRYGPGDAAAMEQALRRAGA